MRSTVTTIDLDALRWNLSVIRRKAGSSSICAMIKANAYGHGMLECARTLASEGVDYLGVALVDEAVTLRNAGVTSPILVLTPNVPHEAELVATHQLTVVICSTEQARHLSKAAIGTTPIEGHVFVDTGMHRDGFSMHGILEVLGELDQLSGLSITGICTHFATTDVRNDAFLSEQLEKFSDVLTRCEEHGRTFAHIHAANTGAIWQAPDSLFTLVRPGLSLYGYANPVDDELKLRPVMSITSRVLSVRRIWPGETVSYGRRFMTPVETTIATVPIGYGDGYTRALTGQAMCLIGGVRYPVVGVVCMDEIMVDVGDADVQVGDEVVILGRQSQPSGVVNSIDATDLALWANTIPYEITTAVNSRIPRVFTGDRGT